MNSVAHPFRTIDLTASPSNTYREMLRKRDFYERFGVDEYWVFDPEDGTLEVWLRDGAVLAQVPMAEGGHVSPTTGVQVSVADSELVVQDPAGGRRWLYLSDEVARAQAAEQRVAELEARLAALGVSPVE